ncbi:MAG: cytochrome c [Bryobacterales bacterium]
MLRPFLLSFFALIPLSAQLSSAEPPALDFAKSQAILKQYCQACHGGDSSLGGFNLDRYPDLESLHAAPEKWSAAAARLRDHDMPPRGVPGPEPEDRERLVEFLQTTLREAACAQGLFPARPSSAA